MDSPRHLMALGMGVGLFENPVSGEEHPLQVDISSQLVLLEETETLKENPADPIGDLKASGDIWTLMMHVKGRFPW